MIKNYSVPPTILLLSSFFFWLTSYISGIWPSEDSHMDIGEYQVTVDKYAVPYPTAETLLSDGWGNVVVLNTAGTHIGGPIKMELRNILNKWADVSSKFMLARNLLY